MPEPGSESEVIEQLVMPGSKTRKCYQNRNDASYIQHTNHYDVVITMQFHIYYNLSYDLK